MSAVVSILHVWIVAVQWYSMQARDHSGEQCLQLSKSTMCLSVHISLTTSTMKF